MSQGALLATLVVICGLASTFLGRRKSTTYRQYFWNNVCSWLLGMIAMLILIAQSPKWYWWALFGIALVAMSIHFYRMFTFGRILRRKGVQVAVRDIVREVYLSVNPTSQWRNDRFVPVHKWFMRLGDVHMIPDIDSAIHDAIAELREYEPMKIVLR